jgi:hypothetical protein
VFWLYYRGGGGGGGGGVYGGIDDSKDWMISGFGVSWTRRFDHWFVSHTTRRRGYGEREGFGTIFRRVTVWFLLGRGIKAALGDADTNIIIRGGGLSFRV